MRVQEKVHGTPIHKTALTCFSLLRNFVLFINVRSLRSADSSNPHASDGICTNTSERVTFYKKVLAIFFAASISWLAVILMCVCTAGLFAVSAPQQLLLLRNSRGGEMMGAACVQVAFNLGNAIGAYAGGLPIDAGLGYRYPALVGVFIVLTGFVAVSLYSKRESASLSKI